MLHAGVIELASSHWSLPVVLVQKNDGSPLFCVDYRRLNAVTRVDAKPIPRIDNALDALAGTKWFSTLD
ncbi:Transposon Ty3-G Gag-Pol polyprotein [Trichinella sp. T6]|nr:Transposon Ty3-G Gag-Pol polyprotein [Trichinella sp. T6]